MKPHSGCRNAELDLQNIVGLLLEARELAATTKLLVLKTLPLASGLPGKTAVLQYDQELFIIKYIFFPNTQRKKDWVIKYHT